MEQSDNFPHIMYCNGKGKGMMIMSFDTIPAKSLCFYINKPDCIIIDLRDNGEYMNGHIPTAVNICYENIEDARSYLSQFKQVILYCTRGNLSLLAARSLKIPGTDIINVYGGIKAYRGEFVRGKNNN